MKKGNSSETKTGGMKEQMLFFADDIGVIAERKEASAIY